MITEKEINKAFKALETEHFKVRVIIFKNNRVVTIAEFLKDAQLKSGNISKPIMNCLVGGFADGDRFTIEGIPSQYA